MLNTYGHITENTAGKASAIMLDTLQGLVTWERFIQSDVLGKNKTRSIVWRRYNPFPDVSAPLAEGVTPAGMEISYTDYVATLEQWGAFAKLTDVIKDTHTDPVLNRMFKLIGKHAAKTLEGARQGTFQGGTNVYYAAGVTTRGTVNSAITLGDLRKITRSFERFDIEHVSEIIKATVSVATQPVEAAFFSIAHVDIKSDLTKIDGWTPVKEYADSGMKLKGEKGCVDDVRFITTSLAKPWKAAGASGTTFLSSGVEPATSAACDVYPVCIFGMDFGGGVRLQGKTAIHPIVLNPDRPSPSDELGQRGSVGWKTYQANVILNQMAIARLEAAVTADPS